MFVRQLPVIRLDQKGACLADEINQTSDPSSSGPNYLPPSVNKRLSERVSLDDGIRQYSNSLT